MLKGRKHKIIAIVSFYVDILFQTGFYISLMWSVLEFVLIFSGLVFGYNVNRGFCGKEIVIPIIAWGAIFKTINSRAYSHNKYRSVADSSRADNEVIADEINRRELKKYDIRSLLDIIRNGGRGATVISLCASIWATREIDRIDENKLLTEVVSENIDKYWEQFLDDLFDKRAQDFHVEELNDVMFFRDLGEFEEYKDLQSAYIRLCCMVIKSINKILSNYRVEYYDSVYALTKVIYAKYMDSFKLLADELESRQEEVLKDVEGIEELKREHIDNANIQRYLLEEPQIHGDFLKFQELFRGYREYADCKVPLATEESNYKPKHMRE